MTSSSRYWWFSSTFGSLCKALAGFLCWRYFVYCFFVCKIFCNWYLRRGLTQGDRHVGKYAMITGVLVSWSSAAIKIVMLISLRAVGAVLGPQIRRLTAARRITAVHWLAFSDHSLRHSPISAHRSANSAHTHVLNEREVTWSVTSPEFCSGGARARGARVPKFVVTKLSRSESRLADISLGQN